jgi:hypothetical protein
VGERDRLVEQHVLGHHPVHQADPAGLVGADQVAGHDHLGRPGQADQARQQVQAAQGGHAADFDPHLAEAGARRREAEVGGQGQLAAGAHRRSVDGGHDGLRHGAQRADRALEGSVDHLAKLGLAHRGNGLEQPRVAARGEGRAAAGEDDGTDAGVGGGPLQPLAQLDHGLGRERVQGGGPVQGQDADGTVVALQDVGHGVSLHQL